MQSFALSLRTLITRSLLVPDRALRWVIIANPGAGGFTINRRWNEHKRALDRCGERVRQNRLRQDVSPSCYALSRDRGEPGGWEQSGLIPTGGPGHAVSITRALVAEAEGSEDFYLIITAGGDGTSLEVLQTLCQAPEDFRSRCAVLRLPMGTGNDGADAWELEKALELLMLPSRIEMVRGLKLSTAREKHGPTVVPCGPLISCPWDWTHL